MEMWSDGVWAGVKGIATGTTAALRAASVPTALTDGYETGLKAAVFWLDNLQGYMQTILSYTKILKE